MFELSIVKFSKKKKKNVNMMTKKGSWTFLLTIAVIVVQLCYTVALPPLAEPTFLKTLMHEDPRIYNGEPAVLEKTKHQVSLRDRDMEILHFGLGHRCGGSLISNNVVLCAAHCFLDDAAADGTFVTEKEFLIVMGNLDRTVKNNNTLIYDIKKIIKYNDFFNSDTFNDDIVLLLLNDTVPANHPTVQPIELNNFSPLDEGIECQVTGWGKTEKGIVPEDLRTTNVPIISLDNCREKTVYGEAIHEGMLCAGHTVGERDSCQGDSGGPLVCGGLQVGIISWGLDCGKPNQPGIYTNIAFYRHWILSKIEEYNVSSPKFIDIATTGLMKHNNTNGTGGGGGGGGGARATFNGSIVLISIMCVFVAILSKF